MMKTIESYGPQALGSSTPSHIHVVTEEVYSDEPATWLAEFDLQQKDTMGRARYQMIHVIRGDQIAEFTLYLGPSHTFASNGFQIYGGSAKLGADETVDSLREWADELRSRGGIVRQIQPKLEQDTWMKHIEEQTRRQSHQSTFGSSVRIERR
jgi:hypothetical protein